MGEKIQAGLAIGVIIGIGVLVGYSQKAEESSIQKVEIQMSQSAPIKAEEIRSWLGTPSKEIKAMESKLMGHEWIQNVRLEKTEPKVLRVSPVLRQPVAIWQPHKGAAQYLDENGEIFGELALQRTADLPVVSQTAAESRERLAKWLVQWNARGLNDVMTLSNVREVQHPGGLQEIQAVVLPWRAVLHWEASVNSTEESRWDELEWVAKNLIQRGIAARQIWVPDFKESKKIVVKTVRSS